MFVSVLSALSTFTTGVWEHSETVTVLGLCRCARETVHSFTKQKIATLYKRKKTFLDSENQALHGFTTENTATFCKKKTLHVFQKNKHLAWACLMNRVELSRTALTLRR